MSYAYGVLFPPSHLKKINLLHSSKRLRVACTNLLLQSSQLLYMAKCAKSTIELQALNAEWQSHKMDVMRVPSQNVGRFHAKNLPTMEAMVYEWLFPSDTKLIHPGCFWSIPVVYSRIPLLGGAAGERLGKKAAASAMGKAKSVPISHREEWNARLQSHLSPSPTSPLKGNLAQKSQALVERKVGWNAGFALQSPSLLRPPLSQQQQAGLTPTSHHCWQWEAGESVANGSLSAGSSRQIFTDFLLLAATKRWELGKVQC